MPEPKAQDGSQPTGDTGSGTSGQDQDGKWRQVRDDIYRRQSQLETKMSEFMGELRGYMAAQTQGRGGEPRQAEPEPIDPNEFKANPAGAFQKLLRREMSSMKAEISREQDERIRQLESQRAFKGTMGRIRGHLLDKYPDLSDEGSEFFRQVDQIYRRKIQDFDFPEPGDEDPSKLFLIESAAQEVLRSQVEKKKTGVDQSKNRAREILQNGNGIPHGSAEPEGADEKFQPTAEEIAIGKKYGLDMESEQGRESQAKWNRFVDENIDPTYRQPRG